MTGAQAVIAQLVAEGVTHILSIPGDHNIALCDVVLDYPQLTYLTGRHEQSLTLIANGYSRASHKIAVPLIISGPGVTNSLTALGDAYQDSVPMVVIASQAPRDQIGKGSFHGLKDQSAMIAAVAKWSVCVDSPEAIPTAIHTAFIKAYEGRPGPTVVEIPLDIQTKKAEIKFFPVEKPEQKTTCTLAEISRAAKHLVNAKRPVVYAGRGVIISNACKILQQLIEYLNTPCFHTALGKGMLAANHPLNVSWGNGRSDYVTQLISQADAVLVIGSSLDYADAKRLNLSFPKTLIQIDVCSDILGRFYPTEINLLGDAKLILEPLFIEIKKLLPTARLFTPPSIKTDSNNRLSFSQNKAQKLKSIQSASALNYIQAIEEGITDDTLIFGDPARCNGWAVAFLERNIPNTFHCSRNFCTLGYAFSAAMGAKLAKPEKHVLAMIGDGGFLFANGDLATAVQYEINIVTLIFNDNCYGSIRKAQNNAFGRTIGVDLKNPDFCLLAKAFGIQSFRVNSPDKLLKTLTQAWTIHAPVIIEIVMDSNDTGFEI